MITYIIMREGGEGGKGMRGRGEGKKGGKGRRERGKERN